MARVIGYVGGSEESPEDAEAITDLDHLVSMVAGTGRSESTFPTKAFSVRMPLDLAAKVRGMASHGNVTLNELMVNLLEFAVGEVYDSSDKKIQNALQKHYQAASAELEGGE